MCMMQMKSGQISFEQLDPSCCFFFSMFLFPLASVNWIYQWYNILLASNLFGWDVYKLTGPFLYDAQVTL